MIKEIFLCERESGSIARSLGPGKALHLFTKDRLWRVKTRADRWEKKLVLKKE